MKHGGKKTKVKRHERGLRKEIEKEGNRERKKNRKKEGKKGKGKEGMYGEAKVKREQKQRKKDVNLKSGGNN